MIDLALNADDNLTLNTDQDISIVTLSDEVAQTVKITLRAWMGEYFLDQKFGVNYDKILDKVPISTIEREIRRVVSLIPEISAIIDLEVIPDRENRTAQVILVAKTIYSDEVTVSL